MRTVLLALGFVFLSLAGVAQDEEELKKVEQEIIEENTAKGKKSGGVLGKITGKLKKDPSEKKEKDLDPKKTEKREAKTYEKSLAKDRPMFQDKYGRPTNAGPRFESDATIKRINRKNKKELNPKPSRKDRKPSRQRYRYD